MIKLFLALLVGLIGYDAVRNDGAYTKSAWATVTLHAGDLGEKAQTTIGNLSREAREAGESKPLNEPRPGSDAPR